jgi:hypothetical protein
MKKTIILFALCLTMVVSSLYSQPKEISSSTLEKIEIYFQKDGEIYFKFKIFSKSEIETLTRIISIDNVIGNDVYAYANKEEFEKFKKLGYDFELLSLPHETATGLTMSDDIKSIQAWNVYPTYDQYVAMMTAFQTNYPNICKLIDIGPTASGLRHLYAIKITDSVNVRKPKPRFLYTSSMHGDEITGYVTMLRLIDTLAKGYGVVPQFTYLLQNVEIWINPLANPDGTYKGGNNTVTGAVRYNNNNIDLNRNYPDPAAGLHPDGNSWQTETVNFMNFATSNYFMLSMNFHGGAEVFNYPWDTWSRYPPDESWDIQIGKHFVDTVHAIAPTYMADNLGYPNYPGVVNGYDWYRVTGGRQDFMTYFRYGREITCEISHTKLPAASTLPTYWNNLNKSLLNFIKESLYGIRGIVTDSITGAKLKAKVYIAGHDADSSWIYSDSVSGDYHRFIATGTYPLTFSSPGYYSKTISNVYAKIDSTTILNVQLKPIIVPSNLTLTAVLSGNYNGTTMISKNITVELHNATTPYSLVESKTVSLNSSGVGNPVYTTAVNGTPYYIVLKSDNGLETWSATPQTFSGNTLNYNFTDLATKAFGSNMVFVTNKWCIISGDANQDGSVDALDRSACWNDRNLSGAYVTDLNGDGVVDALDRSIAWNNRNLSVQKPALLGPNRTVKNDIKR